MGLNVKTLIENARRWWWLLIGLPLLLGVLAFGVGARQTPMYASTVTLQVGSSQSGDASDYDSFLLAEGMATTYRELVTIQPVLDPVVESLSPEYDLASLRASLTIDLSAGTLLKITAAAPSADQSRDVANAVATEFIAYTDEQAGALLGSQQEQAEIQVNELNAEIGDVDEQIAALDSDAAGDQSQLTVLQTERELLREDLTAARRSSQTLETRMASSAGYVQVADAAGLPSSPYAPRIPAYVVLGATLGLLLSSTIIFLSEQLNDRVRRTTDMVRLVGVPRIATVPGARRLKRGPSELYALNQPNHNAAEALRLLRSTLRRADTGMPRTITVCSPRAEAGTSSITANLAVLLARSGVSVLLIDANFESPHQHRMFEVNDQKGLGTILDDPWATWKSLSVPVLQNLHVIPSGSAPDGSSELLAGKRFEELLHHLTDAVEVVLIDAPSLQRSSDALALAAQSEATLLVCREQRTRIPQLQQLVTKLDRVGANVMGVVVNRGSRDTADSGGAVTATAAHDVSGEELPSPMLLTQSMRASEAGNRNGRASAV